MSIPDPTFLLPLPPSFVGRPFLYMMTLGSIFLVLLLALEWSWRLVWGMIEQPAKINNPATAFRWMLLLLMVSALIRLTPDLALFAAWSDVEPATRQWLSVLDKRLDPVASFTFSLAWLIGYLASPMIIYQLQREPLPVHLFPSFQQAKRPLKIGAGAFAMAFALAFLR